MIEFRCPFCYGDVLIEHEQLGRSGTCPQCGQRVVYVVPGIAPQRVVTPQDTPPDDWAASFFGKLKQLKHPAFPKLLGIISRVMGVGLLGGPFIMMANGYPAGAITLFASPIYAGISLAYWVALIVIWLCVAGRIRVAVWFWMAHTLMAAAIFGWAALDPDGVGRYWKMVAILLADLPLSPIYAVRFKSRPILPVVIFASFYWGAVGWLTARRPSRPAGPPPAKFDAAVES